MKLKVNKIYKINNVYDPWDHLVYYVKITGPAQIINYDKCYPAIMLSGGIEGLMLYVYPVDWPSIEEVSSLEQELL